MRNEVAEAMAELVRCLVDDPAAVSLQVLEGTQVAVLELELAPADFGKVLGRGGETADALRTILTGISGAQRWQFTLSLVEPAGRIRFQERRRSDSSMGAGAPVERMRRALESVVRLLVDQPESAGVSVIEGRELVVFEANAARGDLKNLIGVGGARANAIRLLVGKMGAGVGRRFMFQLVEPEER